MNLQQAKALDKILSQFSNKNQVTFVDDNELNQYCEPLESLGLIDVAMWKGDAPHRIDITPQGLAFKEQGGFQAQIQTDTQITTERKWNIYNAKTATLTAIASLVLSIIALLLSIFK